MYSAASFLVILKSILNPKELGTLCAEGFFAVLEDELMEFREVEFRPVNPNNDDKIHAAGMISIKPLKTEMTNASFGLSHEHKNADAIMFTPAKNKLIK